MSELNDTVTDVSVETNEVVEVSSAVEVESTNTNNKRKAESTGSIVGFSVLGLLCLLGYSYFEFLGWMYLSMGNIRLSIVLMTVFALIISTTSFLLPRIWSSNTNFVSKRRVLLMTVTGVIFSIMMLFSFVGVSHYAKIYNSRNEIVSLYNRGIEEAKGLYPDYEKYVSARVDRYVLVLNQVVTHKNTDPEAYYQMVGRFPGSSDEQRVKNLVKSLRRSLQPTNDRLQENFNEWLSGTSNANLWNVSFVSNVTVLDHKIDQCIKNLSLMSSRFFHPGEEKVPYTYSAYTSNDELQTLLSRPEFYVSWRSLLIFLITAFTLIMPTLRDGLRSRKDI